MEENTNTVGRRIKILQAFIIYTGVVIFARLFFITLKSPFSLYAWEHIRTIVWAVLGSTVLVLATYKLFLRNIVQGTVNDIEEIISEWKKSTPLSKLLIVITLLGIPAIIQNFKEWF